MVLFYSQGKQKYTFEGENNKAGIISFIKDPSAAPPPKPKEEDWAADSSSEIVHLTSSSFEPALKDEKSVLVMFYAPWCGHCKKMKPEYEKAADIIKNNKIAGVLTALDATKEPEIAAKFGVKGYPTVKYFVNGEFKFDVNVRDAEKIVEFMKNPSEPPKSPIEVPWEDEPSEVIHLNDENFKPVLKKKTHALVMFYAPWCGHCKRTKPEFVKAAEKFVDDPRIALAAVDCTKYQALCGVYNVKGYPTIKYFNYLKTVRDYSGGRTEADLVKFLSNPDAQVSEEETAAALEPFGDFPGVEKVLILSDNNFDDEIKKYERVLVMFFAPWCGHCKRMKADFAKAALMLETDQLNGAKVAAVDCTVQRKLSERFEIHGFPTMKYFENGQVIADYDGKRTAEAMVDFIKTNGNGAGSKKKDEL